MQLLLKRFHNIVPEEIDLRVGMREDGRVPAAEVQRTGTGDGDLGQEARVGLEELEVADIDRMSPANPALDQRNRLQAPTALVIPASRFLAADRIDLDVTKLLVKEAVIGSPPELPIGGEAKPGLLLQSDGVPDGFVLGGSQCSAINLTAMVSCPRLQQIFGSEQTADMLRPKRWF
jgi:hypothetical protein